MKKIKSFLIIVNLIIIVLLFNISIFNKENILENGRLVLLELAPVDPRSLMQGDYMQLNYRNDVSNLKDIPKEGYCILYVLDNHKAIINRFQAEQQPLNPNEVLVKYKKDDNWRFTIGAESYFFQEGTADKYDSAKYGGLRVDENGVSILIGLYDSNLNLIK